MTEWCDVSLGDVCELKRGYDLPRGSRLAGTVPVISSSGPTGFHTEAKVRAPGVVTGRYGTLGEVFYITEDFWPLNTALYVRDFKGNNPRYVAGLLKSMGLSQYDGAAAVPGLNRNQLHTLPVRIPSVDTQRKIACFLTAVDDLIENNRQRVAVLEEMVREIYREWFTRFRFPGHEKAACVDTTLGVVPEGWTWNTCGDELDFIGGGTPSKKVPAYWEEGTIAWYTPSDLTKNRWRYAAEPELCITEMGVAKSSARPFPAGSVLMTSRATLGVLAIATAEATTNQGFIVVLPDDRWCPGFIREWLDVHAVQLAAIATGATFKEITKGAFKRVPFLLPPGRVLDAYTEISEPIEMQILNLERQVRSLSMLRDFLLPRLVTGQIEVSGLDLAVILEGAVA
ncbi:MAG: restriction endonuclease subunit S [Mycobacterium sp.]